MASTSSNYKQGYHLAITGAHALRTAEVEGAFALPYIKPHFHILDVGCGPGTITTGFAKRVPQGSVTGIDLSEDVISQANTHLSNMESPPHNVTFATGNVLEGLNLPSQSFDMAFCSQTLLHIPDPVSALREMKRLVKPGGLIACREADLPFHYYPELPGIQASHRYLWMLFTGAKSPDSRFPDSYPHPPGHRAGSMVHGFARQAGCDPARITKGANVDVYATPEERKWRAQNMIDRIEKGGHREKFLDLGASKEEIGEMIRDWRVWEEDVDAWYAVLQCEVVCWI